MRVCHLIERSTDYVVEAVKELHHVAISKFVQLMFEEISICVLELGDSSKTFRHIHFTIAVYLVHGGRRSWSSIQFFHHIISLLGKISISYWSDHVSNVPVHSVDFV